MLITYTMYSVVINTFIFITLRTGANITMVTPHHIKAWYTIIMKQVGVTSIMSVKSIMSVTSVVSIAKNYFYISVQNAILNVKKFDNLIGWTLETLCLE